MRGLIVTGELSGSALQSSHRSPMTDELLFYQYRPVPFAPSRGQAERNSYVSDDKMLSISAVRLKVIPEIPSKSESWLRKELAEQNRPGVRK